MGAEDAGLADARFFPRVRQLMGRRLRPALANLHMSLREVRRANEMFALPEDMARGMEQIERLVMRQMMRAGEVARAAEPPEPPPPPPEVAALEGALRDARSEREANQAAFTAATEARVS